MATVFVMKLLVLFSITMTTFHCVNGQIGMAHIVALLKHISDTSTNTSATLPQLAALLKNQVDMQTVSNLLLENNTVATENIEASQTQVASTLSQVEASQSQMANTLTQVGATLTQVGAAHNQTANTLTQIETSQAQMSKTLTEIATTQTQMANTFNQVVNLLERQGQQLQNMTVTLNSVVSVLENQQEILEDINRSPFLPPKSANDCSEIDSLGVYSIGRYTISPSNCPISFEVRCDMDTDGGGWTIFQNRFDGTTDFFRGWNDYERGFGNVEGDYWMGLSKIHCMTQSGNWQLRIDMEAFDGDTAYAVYDSFSVGNASTNYQLNIGAYSGTAGDSLRVHNSMAFSTKDRDNDIWSDGDCANYYKGGWWYNACHESNLNGLYLGPTGNSNTGNRWWHWKGNRSLRKTEMKMRCVE